MLRKQGERDGEETRIDIRQPHKAQRATQAAPHALRKQSIAPRKAFLAVTLLRRTDLGLLNGYVVFTLFWRFHRTLGTRQ